MAHKTYYKVELTMPFDDYPNNVASANLVTVAAPQYNQSGHHHKASDVDTFKFIAPISGTYYFSSTSKIAISVLDVSSNPGGVTVPKQSATPVVITPVETPITPPVTVTPSNPITVTPPSGPGLFVPSDPYPGQIHIPKYPGPKYPIPKPIRPVDQYGIGEPSSQASFSSYSSGADSEASFSSYNAGAESEALLATESLPNAELQPEGEPVEDGNFPIVLVANKTYVIRVKPTTSVAVPGDYRFVVQVPVAMLEDFYSLDSSKMENQAIQLKVIKNTVHIKVFMAFTEDSNIIVPNTSNLTYAEVSAQGIASRWDSDSSGIAFEIDGIKDIKIKIQLYSNSYSPNHILQNVLCSDKQKFVEVGIKNIPGRANVEYADWPFDINFWSNWSITNTGEQHIYTMEATGEPRPIEEFKSTIAHEFAHNLGIGDAYGELGYRKAAPTWAAPENDLMRNSRVGVVTKQDLKMILNAWKMNKAQEFPQE